jgi:outer membrane protein OmpU
MKKFLIATTALVAMAGASAAEVKLGGDARFGLRYNGGAAVKTQLEKRMTVNIDGSTTADNGVTFGARVRIRSDENVGTAVSGARVFARAGGLTVAAGNILGAIESMPNLYGPSVGLTGLGWQGLVTNVNGLGTRGVADGGHFDWDSFSSRGNGAEGIEVIYSMGDFTGHISYSSNGLRGVAPTSGGRRIAAYGAYTFSGWTVALGIQDSNVAPAGQEDKVVLTASGKIGDFGVGFGAAQNGKGANKINKFAINGSYTMGATTISGYVAQQGAAAGVLSRATYGLGASYDMGGGASLVGGIERTTAKTTRADIGVSFRF